ncbi:MAG: hypothetical protein KKF44_04965 [Nanoarchaeota archaeon]|nr:hypothetical protein [Nanoarchaeota archaeon]
MREMKETTIQEIVRIAKELASSGKKWHFHMLTPDCMFNDNKDKHAFILEDEEKQEVYVTYSDERYMDEGKELVKLIHGDKIVKEYEKDEKPPVITDENIQFMLDKAKKLNEKGIHWHHHMLFPDCIFNKHKGNWCIVFEDKEGDKLVESISEEEPSKSLRAIEVLYYAQKS